jgi:hypothetical protein
VRPSRTRSVATGRTARGINVRAAIDAVIVEDDDTDRQLVTADGLDFHAREAECAVAFDRENRFAGFDAAAIE